MRLLNYLQEKYVGVSKETHGARKSISIFVDPTKMDLKMAVEESRDKKIRFMADDVNKKVFAWSSDIMHHDVWDSLLHAKFGKGRSKAICLDVEVSIFQGVAKVSGGNAVMTGSDVIESYRTIPAVIEKLKIDWSWADKYVKVTPWINKIKKNKDLKDMLDEV